MLDFEKANYAAELIAEGKLVVIPTDTLYALTADAHNAAAVSDLYRVKNRPTHMYFPLLVYDMNMASRYVEISSVSERLMKKFWPGGVTMILPVLDDCSIAKNAYNKKNIAIRVPAHPFALEVIKLLDHPIIGTSANISGSKNLKTRAEIYDAFSGDVSGFFIDNELACEAPSTIISIDNNRVVLLREGVISLKQIMLEIEE